MSKDIQEFSGKEIQGYNISKPIGQGKFSTVYKAETTNKNIVALKKIKIFDMMDPKQRDKCLKEVGLMKPLDHPNIIKYIDSFIHNNELIIVTEWAEKGDLKRLLKMQQAEETPFEEIRIWEYMQQIASALNHMHEKRIMHRDLKPANIFIAQDDTLKVGDLGLGREFSSGTIEVYSKVGTPLYMSPELLHGEGYDMKSDVWSLGCIVYELSEFKSPFRNENDKMSLMDLFQNITKGEYKQISKRYSEDLQEIIDKMIVVDPTKRIDTEYVLQKCEFKINQLKKNPKIDCILVNEDIYEKLTLLEYHNFFCKPMNRQPVSKVFFSLSDNTPAENNKKFFYFAELSYWIMSIQKYDKKNKIQAALKLKSLGVWDSVDECAQQLLFDLKKWGIRLPDSLNVSHIRNGYGDTVCFILNDILNRELIRLNFKFEDPIHKDAQEQNNNINTENGVYHDPDLDEYLIEDELDEQDMDENISIIGDNDDDQDNFGKNKRNNKNKGNDDEIDDDGKEIIYSKVDPSDWQKEVLKVTTDLLNFDIKIKNDDFGNKNYTDHNNYSQNLSSIQKYYQGLKRQVGNIQEGNINKVINKWQNELDRIQKGEERINIGNLENINVLKEKVSSKRQYLEDLETKSESVKSQIQQFDQLNDQVEKIKKDIQDREKLLTGNGLNIQIKDAISKIREEIKQMDIKIGILRTNLLDAQRQHELNKHENQDIFDNDHIDDLDDDILNDISNQNNTKNNKNSNNNNNDQNLKKDFSDDQSEENLMDLSDERF